MIAGCIAIVFASGGEFMYAQYAIFVAALLDFLDGLAARLLKAQSPIGKDLDSLADVVTFGVAPSIMLYWLLKNQFLLEIWANAAFLLAAFSAIRLAKFNNDPSQSDGFKGLPTPANAILISTWAFYVQNKLAINHSNNHLWLLATLVLLVLSSAIMVSNLPMLALKFKKYQIKGNEWRISLLLAGILCFTLTPMYGFGLSILTYILISITKNLISNIHEKV